MGARYRAPPAQIRTCPIQAYGSYLGHHESALQFACNPHEHSLSGVNLAA